MSNLAPLPTDNVSLTLMVEALSAQVARLEEKLHALHSTDVNVLRRAHGSMLQHVDALAEEADGASVPRLAAELRSPASKGPLATERLQRRKHRNRLTPVLP